MWCCLEGSVMLLFGLEDLASCGSWSSNYEQDWTLEGEFITLYASKVTFSSSTITMSFASWTSIKVLPVARKRLPKINGINHSSPCQVLWGPSKRLTFSHLNQNIFNYASWVCDWSIHQLQVNHDRLYFSKPQFLKNRKRHQVNTCYQKKKIPIVYGIVKIHRSFSFIENFFCMMVLHSSVSITVSWSSHLYLLDMISKIVGYLGNLA